MAERRLSSRKSKPTERLIFWRGLRMVTKFREQLAAQKSPNYSGTTFVTDWLEKRCQENADISLPTAHVEEHGVRYEENDELNRGEAEIVTTDTAATAVAADKGEVQEDASSQEVTDITVMVVDNVVEERTMFADTTEMMSRPNDVIFHASSDDASCVHSDDADKMEEYAENADNALKTSNAEEEGETYEEKGEVNLGETGVAAVDTAATAVAADEADLEVHCGTNREAEWLSDEENTNKKNNDRDYRMKRRRRLLLRKKNVVFQATKRKDYLQTSTFDMD
jgi:hypothetical protein